MCQNHGNRGKAKPAVKIARLATPVLIAVRGQELGVEALQCRVVGDGVALPTRARREILEGGQVDRYWMFSAEQDRLFAQLQVARPVEADRVEGPSGRVHSLMEVVAGRVRVTTGPEQLGCLVDVKAALGGER